MTTDNNKDLTERAARILIDGQSDPHDRLDAYLTLTGQEFLWRCDGSGADFDEALRRYEATTGRKLARVASNILPMFGVIKYSRQDRRSEVAVWLSGTFLGWIFARGRARPQDPTWHLETSLAITLGLPLIAIRSEPTRTLKHAEQRVIELVNANHRADHDVWQN